MIAPDGFRSNMLVLYFPILLMRNKSQSTFISALGVLLTLSSTVFVGGCATSPEAMKAKKADQLTKFCTEVAKHLMDRDPTTIKESVNQLMHEEVNADCRDKLQAAKILPDSSIDVLKTISDAEVTKKVNEIVVTSVKPTTALDKDDVTLSVTGTETVKVNGKVTTTRPFALTMTCRMTPEMDGYGQLLQLKGFPPSLTYQPAVQSDSSRKKSSSRRRG